MPTYDYLCRACGTTIEVIHPMVEDGPTTCELCGGALRRVIFPSGIIFKGSGFYRNDSRASAAKAEKAEKAEKAAEGPKSSESASTDSSAKTGSDAGPSDSKPASTASSSDHGSSEKARPAGST